MSVSEKSRIQKHFDVKAVSYESSAVLQRRVCDELLQRLDLISLQPSAILDAGCGTGWGTEYLLKKYKKAKVFSLDLSPEMLKQTKNKGGWIRKPHLICADAEDIPLGDASIDLVFSSLMLQWCDYKQVFAEFKRVLKPEGLLMFSTFGPDTLTELKQSWAQVDDHLHVNAFTDMHDLGDELIQVGLTEPVMDMDLLTLTYKDVMSVMTDLKSIGANTLLSNQKNTPGQGLVTPAKLKKVIAHYEHYRKNEVIPASYEVVYGHAWKIRQRATKLPQNNNFSGEFSISVDQIKK